MSSQTLQGTQDLTSGPSTSLPAEGINAGLIRRWLPGGDTGTPLTQSAGELSAMLDESSRMLAGDEAVQARAISACLRQSDACPSRCRRHASPPMGMITPAYVAAEFGLPADTVRGWIRRGLVSSVRFGRNGKFIALAPTAISQLRYEVSAEAREGH